MRRPAGIGLLLVVAGIGSPPAAGAQESQQQRGPSFWTAAAGVATVNWVTWAYNWYVQRWPWARVGTRSWGRNLRNGFVWDNDCFLDNQLAHPYQGSLYHASARASGYGFWSSIPFAAAGSATWELFGENITASLNDLINTSLGGVAIGEVTWRLSSLLGSGHSSGPGGWGRELGAFALSPVGRTQTLLRRRSEDGSGADESGEVATMSLGRRSGHSFFQLAIHYGSPFDVGPFRPYDAFQFHLEVSPQQGGGVRAVAITGLLARASLGQSARSQTLLGLFQHYEYQHLPGFELGGNSLSGALLYRHALGERNRVELGAHLEAVLLGAISSDHGFEWRRDYDLGPGAGGRLEAAWLRDGREWLRLEGRTVWLHSVHGSGGDHLATLARLAAVIPLAGPLYLGGDLALNTRRSSYPDFPSVSRSIPEARAYLSWSP